MTVDIYIQLKQTLIDMGYGEEIEWQLNNQPCTDADDFAGEAVWVILNSGMKNQVAQQIRDRIWEARRQNGDISEVFGHKGKVSAIKYLFDNKARLFHEYLNIEDKIGYLRSLPWIGPITCWHLAKNLGHDCVKPDRHLVRIAKQTNQTPDELCLELSRATGDKVSVVDIILWRAANLKLC